MSSLSIDWQNVLGPLLSSAGGISRSELHQLEAAALDYARRAVRLRPRLADTELPFATHPVPWFERGRFVACDTAGISARPGAFLQHAVGDYYVQDAGSMLSLALCDILPGQWICDACAAPGGKSTSLLESLGGAGLLVANEAIASRMGMLNLALARAGYGNHLATNLDVSQLAQLCGPTFDWLLVDAPCTGQSLVSRGKQSLAAFSASQIEHSSARQLRILRSAANLVKPQGRLVYATCSYSYEENEGVIHRFLDEHPNWQPANDRKLDPWRSPIAEGCYRVWPQREGCAGAFAALLACVEQTSTDHFHGELLPNRQPIPWRELNAPPATIDWLDVAAPGDRVASGQWWQGVRQLHRFDSRIPPDWISHCVTGTPIAEEKTGRWDPLFGSATLCNSLVQPLDRIALDDEQASRYVAGEAVRTGFSFHGWCVATWRGRPLSWGKATHGVLKNHFPKALRQPRLSAG